VKDERAARSDIEVKPVVDRLAARWCHDRFDDRVIVRGEFERQRLTLADVDKIPGIANCESPGLIVQLQHELPDEFRADDAINVSTERGWQLRKGQCQRHRLGEPFESDQRPPRIFHPSTCLTAGTSPASVHAPI
jgi:hypothetical protein